MLISLKNVSKTIEGREILKDINWQVNKGEHWLVYGLNGAGKTTLLNIVNAYEFATTGEVVLFGHRPGEIGYSAQDVRAQMGYISCELSGKFQPEENVRDVVLSGFRQTIGLYHTPTQEEINRAKDVLEQLNIAGFESQCLGKLSSGEQQRVLLARAIINRPKVLVLDEPTNGLDFVGREQFIDTLKRMYYHYPETALIYVTHFIEEISSDVNQALLLKEGSIHAKGEIEDVLNGHHLSKLFNMPVKVYHHHHRYQIVRL